MLPAIEITDSVSSHFCGDGDRLKKSSAEIFHHGEVNQLPATYGDPALH